MINDMGILVHEVAPVPKEKLIEILQATSTGYLVDELLHRIDGAIASVDIYTLHDIDSEIKRASRALTEKWPGDIEKDRFEWSELLRARRRKEIRERKPEGLRKPKNCPKCGRQKIKQILYGYPGPAGLYEPDLSGIMRGGCVIHGDRNDWFCASCGHSWYDPDDPVRIERDKDFERIMSGNASSDSPEDEEKSN
jgi:hypothetical protein